MAPERARKFPVAADEGATHSEFLDSAGVNHPETSPTRAPLRAVAADPETERDSSFLYIAAGVAIALGLFLYFRQR